MTWPCMVGIKKTRTEEHNKKIGDSQRGPLCKLWKGGVKMQKGYRFVRSDGPHGYTQEHRQVAEKALGRKMKTEEHVHHINGDRADNRNDNLLICGRGYHQWLHKRMAELYQMEHFAEV